jgi:peptidoglycan/LPS O-acetylase OafA/YrhL
MHFASPRKTPKASSAMTPPLQRLHASVSARVIPGIDAMRALAITVVVLSHLSVPKVSGNLGLEMFFVLSGFLITSLLLREYKKTGTVSLRSFYIRRAYRILPAFYVCLVVTLVVSLCLHWAVRWHEVLITALYMADYGRAFSPLLTQANYFMTVTWSLGTEEKFYLIWPVLLVAMMRRGVNVRRATVAMLVLVEVYRVVAVVYFGLPIEYAYNAFETRADGLLIGCLLALIFNPDHVDRRLAWLVGSPWLLPIPVALIYAANNLSFHQGNGVFLFFLAVEPLLAAGALVQWIYWGSGRGGVLAGGPVRLLARISYSLYLYHTLIDQIFLGHPMHGYNRQFVVLISVAAATVSYYAVEVPLLRLRDRSTPPPVAMGAPLPT